jgi:hypothetical protein
VFDLLRTAKSVVAMVIRISIGNVFYKRAAHPATFTHLCRYISQQPYNMIYRY